MKNKENDNDFFDLIKKTRTPERDQEAFELFKEFWREKGNLGKV